MMPWAKRASLRIGLVLALLVPGTAVRAVDIELQLTPLAGQDAGAVEYWELCFSADFEIHRLTVGALKPSGYTGPMEWVGCADSASTQCAGAGAMGPYTAVKPAGSFAESVADVLWIVLEGNVQQGFDDYLNSVDTLVCVARLRFEGDVSNDPPISTNTPGLQTPTPEDVGLAIPASPALDWGTADGVFCSEPIILDGDRAFCDPAPSLSQTYTVASTVPEDADADLRRDGEDNCIYKANVDQADNGGLETDVADGVGDACQCGEGDGTGQIESSESDLENMLIHLRGGEASGFDASRCSLANPSTCTIHDAALLDSALKTAATLDNVCDAFSPPSP